MVSLSKAISLLSIAVVSSISTLANAHEIPEGKFNTELNHLREGRGHNAAEEAPREDAVYAMSDVVAEEKDEILIYLRNEIDGSLTFEGRGSANGGIGYEKPGLQLSGNNMIVAGECIIAVNGLSSNDVSTFRMKSASEMEHKGKFSTSGAFPVSVAEREGLVYVLNGGGNGSIQGYTLAQSNCGLTPLVGDPIDLPNSNTIPSQIGFTPEGNLLVTMTVDGGLDSVLTSGLRGSDEESLTETLFTGGPLILLLVLMGMVTKLIVNL